MYESFYGFREKPFSLIPDPDFLYLSRLHKAALNMLEYGLRGEAGFTLISGEVGSGKTILVRRFLKMVDQDTTVGLITNTHSSIGNLLEWILLAFGLDYRGMEKVELYHVFSEFLNELQAEGRRAILIIDEAQNMELDTLEELRMLSNINADKNLVLQIVLVGQPEILEKLNRPEMRQMTQRISVTFRLWPLTFAETCGYVRHRVKVAGGNPNTFDNSACGAIYHFTEGLPRPINILCDAALVYGFGEGKRTIDIDTILDVIEDRQRSGLQPFSRMDKEFDRATLVETISELVETYGTPEMLEEAASLPAEESSFVADDDGYDADSPDNVAPFKASAAYDDDDDEEPAPPRRGRRGAKEAARFETDKEVPDFQDRPPEARERGEAEARWRQGDDEESKKHGGGLRRWVAVLALICIGAAVAYYALPYINGSSKSSGSGIENDSAMQSDATDDDTAASADQAPDSEALAGAADSGESDAAAPDEESVSDAGDADPATAGQQTASRPITVEVFDYGTADQTPAAAEEAPEAPDLPAAGDTAEDAGANAAADAVDAEQSAPDGLVTAEAPSADGAAETAGDPIETDAGDATATAVQRASRDLLRQSGIDGDLALGDSGLEFSSVRGNLTSALGGLFNQWSVDYATAQGTSPCGKALRNGLRCFEENGDWQLVRELNRPTLISLNAPDGRQVHAVLTAMDGERASLLVDGQEYQVNLENLTPYWGGDFLLLWRPPTVFRRLLREGLRGDDVVWLRNQLAAANGSTPPTQDPVTFDAGLKNAVIAFQRSRGLHVDGLVGSETLVHLGAVNRQAGEPVLSDRVL
ncbi:MAG TPA: AAA family ATPase [Kiloniellaceae bacterium]|nr:AAA family ATPase [Kiloniellaceae bacterium]